MGSSSNSHLVICTLRAIGQRQVTQKDSLKLIFDKI